jgi:hypothetical protein
MADSKLKPLESEALARAMIANGGWAGRLGWKRYGDAIAALLTTKWVKPMDAGLAQAIALWQHGQGSLAVDGIMGKKTWQAMQRVLAPPNSPTSVFPPDAPRRPKGFAEAIALYGDPRPLMGTDGTMSVENQAHWRRQILAPGEFAFPIAMHGAQATTKFWAHRCLVSSFEAVFAELDRLGLRERIRSCDGIYNFRPVCAGSHLSLHAFGAAIDLHAATNPLDGRGDMSSAVVDVFEHFGFLWGGRFHPPSVPMHFQYAVGY